MSSYLSKSKKAFKPKAPSSRPTGAGIAGSTQSSVRGSVDRQTQTPQPPHTNAAQHSEAQGASAALPEIVTNGADTADDLQRAAQDASAAQPDQNESLVPGVEVQPPTPRPSSPPHASTDQPDLSREGSSQEQTDRRPSAQDGSSRERRSLRPHRGGDDGAQVLPSPPLTQQAQPQHISEEGSGDSIQPRSLRRRQARRGEDSVEGSAATEPPHAQVLPDEPQPGGHGQDEAGEDAPPTQGRRRGTSISSRIERLAEAVVGAAADADSEEPTGEGKRKAKRGKRKREATPEEFETNRIAPTVVTMTDLTKDSRLGKKSTRERRLQARDRQAAQKKLEAAQEHARQQIEGFMADPTLDPGAHSPAGPSAPTSAAAAAASSLIQAPPSAPAILAPRVRLVNGQIVQDEESRVVDRHAAASSGAPRGTRRARHRAGASDDGEDDGVVSEDELTRRINSGSYMRRERHAKWTPAETDTFFEGLRMFGTDFMTVSKLFPGRTRRQIKLKFNKEERLDAERVRRALVAERRPASVDEFERLAGLTLRSTEEWDEELVADRRRLEAEQEAESAALRQMQSEREAAAQAEAEGAKAATAAAGMGKGRAKGTKIRRAEPVEEQEEVEVEVEVEAEEEDSGGGGDNAEEAVEAEEEEESEQPGPAPPASPPSEDPPAAGRSTRRRTATATAQASDAAEPANRSLPAPRRRAADAAGARGGRGAGRGGAALRSKRTLRQRAKQMIKTM